MTTKAYRPSLGVLFLLCGGVMSGQVAAESKWRVGVAYRPMFNVDVSFENRGASPAAMNPPDADRSYADGFVGTDSTGNALDLTTYWGYEQTEQWAGDAIAMRNSQRGGLGKDENLWANGLELVVGRELGENSNVRWGVEGAFSYNRLDAKWSGMAAAGVLSLDAFPLGGVIPPGAPYSGPQIAGPGVPLLGATPDTVPLSVAGDFDANIYGFRFGPYVEFLVAQRCSIALGGGLSLAVVDGKVGFRETAPDPYAALGRSTRGSQTDVVVGGYASGQINVQLTKGWEAFTGIQFHVLNDSKHKTGDKIAKLDLGAAWAWVLGIQYRF